MYLSLQLPDENPKLSKHMRRLVIVVYNQQQYYAQIRNHLWYQKPGNTMTHVHSSLHGVTWRIIINILYLLKALFDKFKYVWKFQGKFLSFTVRLSRYLLDFIFIG